MAACRWFALGTEKRTMQRELSLYADVDRVMNERAPRTL
jgi:hypothetical protein